MSTKKHITTLLLLLLISVESVSAQGIATIKARFHGMERDKVYLNFVEQRELDMEFPYKEGRVIEYQVELDGLTMLRINTFVNVLIQPGDNLEVDVDYVGRNYRQARFSGTSAVSVVASTVLDEIRAERLKRKYKVNIPAALAVQTSSEVFFKSSVDEWREELALLDSQKAELTSDVYLFVSSELDAVFIPNIINYPGSEQQAGYWEVFDNYRLRDDDISLSNFSYLAVLNPYLDYQMKKKAHAKGEKYIASATMKEKYKEISNFYQGKLRDGALMVFLYSIMASGKDFETAESLYNDYIANYNINPKYKKILTEIMK